AVYPTEPWVEHFDWLEAPFNQRPEISQGGLIRPTQPRPRGAAGGPAPARALGRALRRAGAALQRAPRDQPGAHDRPDEARPRRVAERAGPRLDSRAGRNRFPTLTRNPTHETSMRKL